MKTALTKLTWLQIKINKQIQAQECHYPENACIRNFFKGNNLKVYILTSLFNVRGLHLSLGVQPQFVIGSTATIKLLANSVHVVYLVLVQRLKPLEIIVSLVLNPN